VTGRELPVPGRKDIHTILVIGSGPIVIGQACEFDYSGTQAVTALREEGYRVVLVNPNPATVMTTPGIADAVYLEPLEIDYLTEIIRAERPDALLPTMGGQTALNLTLELHAEGVLLEEGVEVIGSRIEAIHLAEDRGLFKTLVAEAGLESPASVLVDGFEASKAFLNTVQLPVVIRPSYTLGGKGGSIALTRDDVKDIVERACAESPSGEALVEECLTGWREFELEAMRDREGNAIVVCSIENVDPMGVHTGDSITVAPAQTLSDREYQEMRNGALEILRRVGVDCGGSNVQFALEPETGRMVVIEMNPRVSRSSALASKATGFPIARCSAKLAVGFTLDEIINEITGKTVSCFEPALDYCAVKVPRFEIGKFPAGYDLLGTQMKSVGESLGIGRTFIEALNKAIRAVESGFDGLEELDIGYDGLDAVIETMHPLRIFGIYTVLKREGQRSIEKLARLTGYDGWFLDQMYRQVEVEYGLAEEGCRRDTLMEAKRAGLSDARVAGLCSRGEEEIRALRNEWGIHTSYHFVDTCAGEFEAETPYLYSTYGEIDEGRPLGKETVLIIGSGPNRIGQGLEFDTCCTLASMAFRKAGAKTIMVNSNPETVSTDFNISDRLYIEPLTEEHVREIARKESVRGVVLQLGGQTALDLAPMFEKGGIPILGTSRDSIDTAEDRSRFSRTLTHLGILQPENRSAEKAAEILHYAEEIGFPVLLRPSFVLGGSRMVIAFTPEEIDAFVSAPGLKIGPEAPVLVDKFLEDAFEYDLDALCDGDNAYIAGIMQHIEAAGIHSGDSACVFPPYKVQEEIIACMKDAAVKLARHLDIRGFMNIQFAVKDGLLYVLEVNPRASRTVPFLAKASGVDIIDAAAAMWLGRTLEQQGLTREGTGAGSCITGWAVKEAVFSFNRFLKMDPRLGPEMKSTGEVIGTGTSFGEAYAKAQAAAGSPLPVEGRVFVSVNRHDRETILPVVQTLKSLGFEIMATRGTAEFLFSHGMFCEVVLKVHEGRPNLLDHLRMGRVHLLINTPLGRFSQKGDESIRTEAVKWNIPYTTTTSAALAACEGIKYLRKGEKIIRSL